jgi:hypothetical protein
MALTCWRFPRFTTRTRSARETSFVRHRVDDPLLGRQFAQRSIQVFLVGERLFESVYMHVRCNGADEREGGARHAAQAGQEGGIGGRRLEGRGSEDDPGAGRLLHRWHGVTCARHEHGNHDAARSADKSLKTMARA